MDDLLTPVRTIKKTQKTKNDSLQQRKPLIQDISLANVRSLDDALQILKDSPSYTQLQSVLHFMQTEDQSAKTSTAIAAQIINILVTETVPNWWEQLHADEDLAELKTLLLEYLRDVTALGAIVSRIRILTALCNDKKPTEGKGSSQAQLASLLSATEAALSPKHTILGIYRKSTLPCISKPRQAALWKDFTAIVASGRLLSAVAAADGALKDYNGSFYHLSWLPQGKKYTYWFALNLATAVESTVIEDANVQRALADLMSKAFSLGYPDILVETLIKSLHPNDSSSFKTLKNSLVERMPAYHQRTFLVSTLQYLGRDILPHPATLHDVGELTKSSMVIRGSAALIHDLVAGNVMLSEHLTELCIKLEGNALVVSHPLRRAVLASLAHGEDCLSTIMEKSMDRFGDQLFIRHAPIVQQEANAQILLMSCGYVQRKLPMLLFTIAKSSTQTRGISNRLKATSARARWLGMIVGMTVSQITDKSGSLLTFEDPSMETDEATWYRNLVKVDDEIGSIQDLQLHVVQVPPVKTVTLAVREKALKLAKQPSTKKHVQAKALPSAASGLRIVELDGDIEDDDMIPYAKPDSDPEDEDEDPTLVERNKPKAPVYIRDLISGLRDTDNYDRHRLALQTSTNLIRRKASFGKEVSDHAEELASILLGLNDDFEMEDFLELRQDSLIALLVAQPGRIASYFARCCFEGGYSLQQRASMLAALGLGAREIAGFKDEGRPDAPDFPTKQLPEHLRQIYGAELAPSFAKIAGQIEHTMVEPMALKAADQLSGPNALKVRTFSSRMAVERARKKPIANQLAKLVGEHFFFPLIGGWWAQTQSFGSRSISFSKHLLPMYLRTLSIILHASGPSTLSLPQMTSEFWGLVLSLRSNASGENDPGVLEALLFSFLTLLDINEDKQRLANEHAKELIETQEWAKLVLDQHGSEADKIGGRIRMLAAAVVVRCYEIVEKWQRLMLGDMVDL